MRPLILLFLFFCFFPFVRVLPLDMDAQPNALILGALIILFSGRKEIKKYNFYLLLILLTAIILMIFTSPDIMGLRILTNYISLFVIAYATYISLAKLRGLPYSLFKLCVYLWGAVAFIQIFYDPLFLSQMTYRGSLYASDRMGRGVFSLAAEPTFYGMICVFMMMVNYINFRDYWSYKLINVLCLVQLVLFSRSTTCFMALCIAFAIYSIYLIFKSKHPVKVLLIVSISLVVGYFALKFLLDNSDSRLSRILGYLIEKPSKFLTYDISVNHRFAHAFLTIKGFFENFGLPHGFNKFPDYIVELLKDDYWGHILMFGPKGQERITTSFGGTLFELGILSLPLWIVLYKCVQKLNQKGYNGTFIGVVLFSMMLNAMNFNQSILPYFIGNLIYLYYHTPAPPSQRIKIK